MTASQAIPQPLNEVQLMLLRLFSRPVSPKDLEVIRNFLVDYYENLLQQEVDRSIKTKGITRADFDQVLNKQQRTKGISGNYGLLISYSVAPAATSKSTTSW